MDSADVEKNTVDKVSVSKNDKKLKEFNESLERSPIGQLSFIDRYLSVWIILTMIIGVVVGYYVDNVPDGLNSVKILDVGLPVAIGLWLMMWPVLIKVRYEAFKSIAKMKGTLYQLIFSFTANWIIGPFLMLGCAWACLPDLALLRNGVILVGLARCIAMVLIWNHLAAGDPEYCAILVAMNSFLQILLYSPMAYFFLVVISNQYTSQGEFELSFLDVFYSVLIFLGIPLVAAIATRYLIAAIAGMEWLEKEFCPRIGFVALLALLWTTFAIFAIQGKNIVENVGDVARVAVPMVMYFFIMFTGSLMLCRKFKFGYEKSVTQAFTASSNNFELAIAVAAATFGTNSPEALAATIGPLVEVPVLLTLVYVALWLKNIWDWPDINKELHLHETLERSDNYNSNNNNNNNIDLKPDIVITTDVDNSSK